MKTAARLSSKQIYIWTAIITFFCIITAQVFWSTIHGDGAVYAWVIRQITENGIFSGVAPKWTQFQIFAEHPYLFFYFGVLFTKVLGFSDLVLKLPNFIIAAVSLYLVYQASYERSGRQAHSYQIGLTACYILILNAIYTSQISQPTLDPMAHMLVFVSALFLVVKRNVFLAGLFLGLAFLTKGLEMLPHLAAFSLVSLFKERHNLKSFFKNYSISMMGLLIPILIWLAHDILIWKSLWMNTYWERQFTNRLLSQKNMQTLFDLSYFITFIQSYIIEIIILIAGVIKFYKKSFKEDLFFLYFTIYIFFNILAFTIIKKDSNQHMTGILLFGSIVAAEFLWQLLKKMNKVAIKKVPYVICLISMGYWAYFIVSYNRNSDIWSSIRQESKLQSKINSQTPIIIRDNAAQDGYGLFFTTQWYFPQHKVYRLEDAKQFEGQTVIMVSSDEGKLSFTQITM